METTLQKLKKMKSFFIDYNSALGQVWSLADYSLGFYQAHLQFNMFLFLLLLLLSFDWGNQAEHPSVYYTLSIYYFWTQQCR